MHLSFARQTLLKLVTFGKDQTGSISIFAMTLFLLMVMMSGLAVDLMKHEQIRVRLQNTLDRCTLMAASLDQRLEAEAVVRDCVGKDGLASQLASVKAVTGFNSRDVQTVGVAPTRPYFLPMMGIKKLDANAASAASQKINNIEIALVLDVSGSMAGARLANLKTAAKEFVATILSTNIDNRVSITIVPYNAQVNLGADLRAKYNAVNVHGVADVNCLEIPAMAYGSLALSRTLPLPMMAYADIATNTNTSNVAISPTDPSFAKPNYNSTSCKSTIANTVRLPGQNIATLQSQINNLQAGGNTSIMLGMKWGVTLLDPASRPMFSEFVAAGKIPASLEGRPFAYDDPESLKIVILMTDGEHVYHRSVIDTYKTGPSPIYKSGADNNYSIYHAARAGTSKYWVPHLGVWQAAPWSNAASTGVVVQQQWEQIWSNLKMSYVSWQFYARALGTDSGSRNTVYSNMNNTFQSIFASVATMDAQLQQSCSLAKANDVIVFGIAFEAPPVGQTQISKCSTSVSHYFNAQGLEISTAFRSIANNITQLKLTQ